ncbi:hypothetical protein G7Y89_g9237 [Cudoniella acicularis]|uniref:Uncharacterized protein n=1 Tax=Cudoniella acicularis TaxID=354080 RepID=A0A8H4RFZ9_9HELO|nr:hypothetical protein G7Y89_g9237 [Cudoniella acicularis]
MMKRMMMKEKSYRKREKPRTSPNKFLAEVLPLDIYLPFSRPSNPKGQKSKNTARLKANRRVRVLYLKKSKTRQGGKKRHPPYSPSGKPNWKAIDEKRLKKTLNQNLLEIRRPRTKTALNRTYYPESLPPRPLPEGRRGHKITARHVEPSKVGHEARRKGSHDLPDVSTGQYDTVGGRTMHFSKVTDDQEIVRANELSKYQQRRADLDREEAQKRSPPANPGPSVAKINRLAEEAIQKHNLKKVLVAWDDDVAKDKDEKGKERQNDGLPNIIRLP